MGLGDLQFQRVASEVLTEKKWMHKAWRWPGKRSCEYSRESIPGRREECIKALSMAGVFKEQKEDGAVGAQETREEQQETCSEK